MIPRLQDRIPSEIWDHVIDVATHYDPFNQWIALDELLDNIHTAYTCALVCKAWYPRSRFYLSHGFQLRYREKFDSWVPTIRNWTSRGLKCRAVFIGPSCGESVAALESWIALLAVRLPQVMSSLREMWIQDVDLTRTHWSFLPGLTLSRKSLRKLVLNKVQLGSTGMQLPFLLKSFAYLDEVDVIEVHPNPTLRSPSSLLPGLASHTTFSNSVIILPAGTVMRWKKVFYDNCSSIFYIAFIKHLAARSVWPNLTHLRIHSTICFSRPEAAEHFGHFVQACSKLQVLEVCLDGLKRVATVPLNLDRNVNLTDVALVINEHPSEALSHIPSILSTITSPIMERFQLEVTLTDQEFETSPVWPSLDTEIAENVYLSNLKQANLLVQPPSIALSQPQLNMKPIDYSQVFAKSRQLTRIPLVIRYKDRNRITIPTHGRSVVTCLMLSQGNIITASDDATIHVYEASNGRLIHSFEGHVGGVWAIERYQNVLVSGSTDRTVRVWDLEEGRCTHIFSGHTSSVRALTIIKPECIDMEDEDYGIRREIWPKRPLIVTGSRDHTLRVWTLPDPRSDMEYGLNASESEEYVESNPYHIFHLEGHEHAVRCLAAKGRTLVSGSYDNTLRVWDLVTGHCAFTLRAHTDRVYAVALDHKKHLVCSSSMDGTIIGWNVLTGEQLYTLNGHTSLVGILGLSPSHIVSGSADATIRVWDPDTLQLRWTFKTANSVTSLQHNQSKILYGSDGILSVLDIEHGTHTRNLHLSGSIWQVAFDDRWCVAASSSSSDFTFLDIWDFSDSKEWTGRT